VSLEGIGAAVLACLEALQDPLIPGRFFHKLMALSGMDQDTRCYLLSLVLHQLPPIHHGTSCAKADGSYVALWAPPPRLGHKGESGVTTWVVCPSRSGIYFGMGVHGGLLCPTKLVRRLHVQTRPGNVWAGIGL
jgi:hypothetical protein